MANSTITVLSRPSLHHSLVQQAAIGAKDKGKLSYRSRDHQVSGRGESIEVIHVHMCCDIIYAHVLNICNCGVTGRGAQLEITPDLRRSPGWRERIARIARGVIEQHAARLEEELTRATPMGG